MVSTGTDEVIELQDAWSRSPSGDCLLASRTRRATSGSSPLECHLWLGRGSVGRGVWQKGWRNLESDQGRFVFNITKGEKIASGIPHPHSLVAIDSTIAYCGSGNMAVHILGRGHVQHLPGYARGLCLVDQHLFVGTSIERRISKSTGMLNSPNATGALAGQCTISRLSLDRFEIEDTVDMTPYGEEIYDLLPIEDTSRWPVVSMSHFFPQKQPCKKASSLDLTTRELAALIPSGEAFILVDQKR